MNDFSSFDNPFELPQLTPFSSRGRRRRTAPYITPDDEQSLMRDVVSGGLGAMTKAGNLLDTAGASVRNLIAGKNPFTPMLSPLSQEGRQGGRDQLEQWGVLGSNEPGLDFGDVAGFGYEVLTDPLTYMTLGASALSKAGKVAKAAGLMDKLVPAATRVAGKRMGWRSAQKASTLEHLLDRANFASDIEAAGARTAAEEAAKGLGTTLADLQGKKLGGMWALGLPFTNSQVVMPGGKLAARGLDALGDYAKGTRVGRFGRMLFDASVGGKYGRAEQEVAERAYAKQGAAYREATYGVLAAGRRLEETFDAFDGLYGSVVPTNPKGPDDQLRRIFSDIVRDTAERAAVPTGAEATAAAKQLAPSIASLDSATADAIAARATEMTQAMENVWKSIQTKGGRAKFLNENATFGHFPRYVDKKNIDAFEHSRRVVQTSVGSMIARTPETRSMRQEVINRLLQDPKARGPNAAAYIQSNYAADLDPLWKNGGVKGHASDLATWVKQHKVGKLYTRKEIEDFRDYTERSLRLDKSMDAIHEFIRDNVLDPADFMKNLAQGRISPARANEILNAGMSLGEAFKMVGMNPKKSLDHFQKIFGVSKLQSKLMRVDMETVNAIRALLEPQKAKSVWAQKVLGAIDKVNNVMRSTLTLPFPSFHGRNFFSGQYMNLGTGYINGAGDLTKYLASFREARRIFKEKDQAMMDEITAYGVLTGARSRVGEIMGETEVMPGASDARALIEGIPAKTLPFVGKPLGKTAGAAYGGVEWLGEKAFDAVEFYNRVPMYLYLRKKGWSKEAAAGVVDRLQFDYTNKALTPFERNIAKRTQLFYTFTRRSIPLIFEELTQRPGGAMAQTIKWSARRRGETPLPIPDYLEQGTVVPQGKSEDGTLKFISGLGLPYEDAFQFLPKSLTPTSLIREPAMEVASRMSPILKAPMELMFNQSLFQPARPLDQLDPNAARLLANITGDKGPVSPLAGSPFLEHLLANSPLSRVLTTGRMLSDPRKTKKEKLAQFFTGLRTTDISPQVQEGVIRDAVEKRMRSDFGSRQFPVTYIPEDRYNEMSPETQAAADRFNNMLKELQRRQRARKESAAK